MNHKILLFVFAGCLLIFFGGKFLKKDHIASPDPMIARGDTSLVDRIHYSISRDCAEEFRIVKEGDSSIRKADEPEVFLIDGFDAFSLKANFDRFRDKNLVHVNPEDLTSLEWTNTSGKKEVIVKEDGIWHYAGMEKVDSFAFASYLTTLVNIQGSELSEHSTSGGLILVEKLTLYGNSMRAAISISAYRNPDSLTIWLIHSSDHPEAYFLSDSSGNYKRIFSDLTDFWP